MSDVKVGIAPKIREEFGKVKGVESIEIEVYNSGQIAGAKWIDGDGFEHEIGITVIPD